MSQIRVILGEDHTLVRDGTRRILEQQPDLAVVGEAGEGRRVLELVSHHRPDVVLLDIRMPEMGGIEALREIRRLAPETKVLVLTAHANDDYVLAAMEAGAAGYLLKTVRAGELVEAVRAVHRGEAVLHPIVAAQVARLWQRRGVATQWFLPEPLTPRETEVLRLLARALHNQAIADELGISVRTAEGHVRSILSKLGVSSRMEAVLYAVSRQWVSLEGEQDPGRP